MSELCDAAEAFLNTLFGGDVYEDWKSLRLMLHFGTDREFVAWMITVAKEYIAQRLSQTSILAAEINKNLLTTSYFYNNNHDNIPHHLQSSCAIDTNNYVLPTVLPASLEEEPQNLVKRKLPSHSISGKLYHADELEDCAVRSPSHLLPSHLCKEEECRSSEYVEQTKNDGCESSSTSALALTEECEKLFHTNEGSVVGLELTDDELAIDCPDDFVETEDLGGDGLAFCDSSAFTLGKQRHGFGGTEGIGSSTAEEGNPCGIECDYTCSICGMGFNHLASLESHQLTGDCLESAQAEDGPHECSVCGKVFTDKLYLEHHTMRTHSSSHHPGTSPSKRFQCVHCERRFSREALLLSHLKTHGVDRPFQCKFCPLTFSQCGARNAHARVHTGERPFACDFCDKRFSVRTNLLRHRRLHTGERPHLCKVCRRGFSRVDTLRGHMQSCHSQADPNMVQ